MRLRGLALALALMAAAGLAPAQAAQPERVFALGGPAVLPDAVLEEIAAETGRQPVRLAGADRYATAVEVSRHAHPDGADTLYVATGRDYPDALAAAPAVTSAAGALLLVDGPDLPEETVDELHRLGPERVFALGGPAALPEAVLRAVATETGREPVRLAGGDRYATAVGISRHAHPHGAGTVYLATGRHYADALAASAAVAATRGALLLVDRHRLPEIVADELQRLAPRRVLVLGGPRAVSDAVVDQVATVTGVRPARLAGADRFATAAAVAAHAHPDGAATMYVATGRDFADALAAAPAVAVHDAALRLVETRPPPVRWIPDLRAARDYAATRSGSVSFAAIGTDGHTVGHRADTVVPAASVLKVMFLVAYLRHPDVRDRPLDRSDRDLLEPMIRKSANEPATRIADLLGPGPMNRLAERAGMRDFAYTRPWGQTRTSARDQVRFLLDLPRHLPERHRAYALQLLTEIVPEQRWGIGAVPTPGWTQHFKGGWGSGSGAVSHQVVLLRHRDGSAVALAVMTTGNPSHSYSETTLRGVFRNLLADLP